MLIRLVAVDETIVLHRTNRRTSLQLFAILASSATDKASPPRTFSTAPWLTLRLGIDSFGRNLSVVFPIDLLMRCRSVRFARLLAVTGVVGLPPVLTCIFGC